jgi:uncharacterized protein (DUF488 family)
MTTIYTIGHSNHEFGDFLNLLRLHGITAIADVRSYPVSGRFPQFNKSEIKSRLLDTGIRYVFLGEALGARPRDRDCYDKGVVDFDRVRQTKLFLEGLESLRRGAIDYRICLMCAERDPADCHRTWLVAQPLHDAGAKINHILADGSSLSHDVLLRRVAGVDSGTSSLFGDDAEVLVAAARRESTRVAHCLDDHEIGVV